MRIYARIGNNNPGNLPHEVGNIRACKKIWQTGTMKNFLKYFWIIPTDLKGGFRFQINIPIGRLKKKRLASRGRSVSVDPFNASKQKGKLA